MDRDELKQQYLAYRDRARTIIRDGDERLPRPEITVSEHANVHPMDDGAFVECVVWVPKSLL